LVNDNFIKLKAKILNYQIKSVKVFIIPEIIDLNVDRVAKERLEVENEFLKKENAELKKIQDEYREFKFSTQYNESRSKSTQELITGILGLPVTQEIVLRLLTPKVPPLEGLHEGEIF